MTLGMLELYISSKTKWPLSCHARSQYIKSNKMTLILPEPYISSQTKDPVHARALNIKSIKWPLPCQSPIYQVKLNATENHLIVFTDAQFAICLFSDKIEKTSFKAPIASAIAASTRYIFYIKQNTQQTRDVGPMLCWCWPIVYDAGPTSPKHCVNASCCVCWVQFVFSLKSS